MKKILIVVLFSSSFLRATEYEVDSLPLVSSVNDVPLSSTSMSLYNGVFSMDYFYNEEINDEQTVYEEDVENQQKSFEVEEEVDTEQAVIAQLDSFRKERASRFFKRKRKFLCSYSGCKGAFYREDRLVAHKAYHTGTKPFNCELCSASFTRMDRLKTHKKTHTGAFYVCDNCERKFTQKHHLKKHIVNKVCKVLISKLSK